MRIRSIRHKGLRASIVVDDASVFQPQIADKLRAIVTFPQDMQDESELRSVPRWKAHLLTGDRRDVRSLFVARNWRLTFRIDHDGIEINDLDYEDYH